MCSQTSSHDLYNLSPPPITLKLTVTGGWRHKYCQINVGDCTLCRHDLGKNWSHVWGYFSFVTDLRSALLQRQRKSCRQTGRQTDRADPSSQYLDRPAQPISSEMGAQKLSIGHWSGLGLAAFPLWRLEEPITGETGRVEVEKRKGELAMEKEGRRGEVEQCLGDGKRRWWEQKGRWSRGSGEERWEWRKSGKGNRKETVSIWWRCNMKVSTQVCSSIRVHRKVHTKGDPTQKGSFSFTYHED